MTTRDKEAATPGHSAEWYLWRYLSVGCPRCKARVGWRCRAAEWVMDIPHRERIGAYLGDRASRGG